MGSESASAAVGYRIVPALFLPKNQLVPNHERHGNPHRVLAPISP